METTKITEDAMVDTRNFILTCNKFSNALVITAENCEPCQFHGGIIEIGRAVLDAEGLVTDRIDVPVTASEMDLELLPEGRMRIYQIICSRPKALGVAVLGMIQHGKEVI
jgi:hypothetical protein